MRVKDVELLAPAGSYDSLRAAINAGADAVYIGGSLFGARAYADNLEIESMLQAIDYVHIHGKSLYLTVNTLLKNDEISRQLYDYILPMYKNGLDAVIVQDMGVFNFIKENFPGMDIHASTQMTVTGVHSARLLKEAGASRIVTARELSLDEIRKIHDSVDIEIESFIHGALCYCYSGQCLFSSMLGGRSGNRGRCAQPCRLPFNVTGKNLKNNDNEKYVLSPKDMCTLDIIPDIIESGVYSMKIEGRMKSPEYVAGVVEMYRKYIDIFMDLGREGFKIDENDYKKLTSLYSRNGFSSGYYKQHNGRNMISLSKATYNSVDEERVKALHEKYVAIDNKLKLEICAIIKADIPMEITVACNGITATATGDIPQLSNNRPAEQKDIEKQLKKLGNTPFECEKLTIILDEGLFIPVKTLNELRRDVIKNLEEAMIGTYKRKVSKFEDIKICDVSGNKSKSGYYGKSFEIICSIETKEQFYTIVEKNEVSKIYLSTDFINDNKLPELINKAHENGKECFITMPFIFRDGAEKHFLSDKWDADGYIVKNIDELGFLNEMLTDGDNKKKLIADYSLYTMNNEAGRCYRSYNIDSCTIPFELNYPEICKRSNIDDELVVYGYIPLMVTAGCVKKTLNKCDATESMYVLKDRYKKDFRVKTSCKYCYNVIYNSLPLSLISSVDQISKTDINKVRLNFTFETEKETSDIIDMYIESFVYGRKLQLDIGEHTKGHFKRKVD